MKLRHYYPVILFLIWSCSDPVTKPDPNIFIGGFRQEFSDGHYVSYARNWKNGEPTDVTDGSKWIVIKCMTVSGNDVFLGGHEREITGGQWKARYWRNGAGVTINEEHLDVECIAVSGNDVYAGSGSKTSKGENSWKNGVPVTLESSLSVNAITIVGDDIYVAGVSQNSKAAYWKNGVITEISDAGSYEITSIAVSGNDVYVAGQINPPTGSPGTETAVYWKNGDMTVLGGGSIRSIAVSNSDIYVAGYGFTSITIIGNTVSTVKVGRYWKNIAPVDIEPDISIVGIAVDGNDVHLVSEHAYWKNQMESTVNASDSTDYFRSIIIR